ncbi:MAG: cell division protein SepF [Promethearchaeota archaeon]
MVEIMRIIDFFRKIWKRQKEKSVKSEEKQSDNSRRLRFRNHKILKSKIQYIKAIPLLGLADIPSIQTELKGGNIVILNISDFTQKAENKFRELKRAVDQLSYISKIHNGEIAQLGEKYLLLTPSPSIKIWKEKIQINY